MCCCMICCLYDGIMMIQLLKNDHFMSAGFKSQIGSYLSFLLNMPCCVASYDNLDSIIIRWPVFGGLIILLNWQGLPKISMGCKCTYW